MAASLRLSAGLRVGCWRGVLPAGIQVQSITLPAGDVHRWPALSEPADTQKFTLLLQGK